MPDKGRQTPTTSVVLSYEKTEGQDAINLYNSTGKTAMEWQELLIYDMMAVNDEGLWVHTKFGFSVPRRNGKTEIVYIRELEGLRRGEHILHSAHRTTTTHSSWEKLLDLCEKAKLDVTSTFRAFGKEHIYLANGGRIEFRTRTTKGGLGEGFDLLVIDEAQEYQDDQETALKYVVTDSQNPQTIFCGTPPTAVSTGTVFVNLRNACLAGQTQNTGWVEWSVDQLSDPRDRSLWWETNPSMGTILTERKIADEVGSGDNLDFNIQRLGYWVRHNLKSAISANEWRELQVDVLPDLVGGLHVGIKYGHDGLNAALAVAARTAKGEIFVECIDCREVRSGNDWILSFLSSSDVQTVVIDGANGQDILRQDMEDAKIKTRPILPRVPEIIAAGSMFEQAVFAGSIKHMKQPSLENVVTNCEKRAIGTNGGFGYKSIKDGADVSLLDAVVLAHWACATRSKEKRKQRVSY